MLQGLPPNSEFDLTFELDIASAYPENSVGIGGSPGASVFVKAGAVPRPPLKIPVGNYFEIDIDKGNQSTGGTDMIVLGTLGTQGELGQYQLIKRQNASNPMKVRSSTDGTIWLLVGIDSGFEGKTTIYFDRIRAKLKFLRNVPQNF